MTCRVICVALVVLMAMCQASAGSAHLLEEDVDMLRGVEWDADRATCARTEGVEADEARVVVSGKCSLYGLEVSKVVYEYEQERMCTRRFFLEQASEDMYGAVFFSLLTRYGEPAQVDGSRQAVWGKRDLNITLALDESLTVTYARTEGAGDVERGDGST